MIRLLFSQLQSLSQRHKRSGVLRYRWVRRALRMAGGLFVFFILFDLLFPLRPSVQYSPVVLAKDGTLLYSALSPDDKWRMKASLEQVSPALLQAILAKEDRYFYYHPGINAFAVARAAFNNVFTGRRTSGASTITMQTVRLLRPARRTYWNKAREMLGALQLEWHYSKDEILELYLNLLPYGGNVEGVRAAATLFFQRQPQALSLAQAVTLCVVPNRPTSLRLGEKNVEIEKARNRWLQNFKTEGVFPDDAVRWALAEPLNARREPPPKFAPHFARRMINQNPQTPEIHTLLNYNLQRKVQDLTANYIRRIRRLNISNAAVMVVNNQTKAVEAYVGSADFDNVQDQGQVDGVSAIRSPGSALKPLLYGAAFDGGHLTPRTVLVDAPVNYWGYMPENYDQQFYGPVTAADALGRSLNIPAIKTLEKVGVGAFVNKLSEAGFRQIERDAKKMGLSMILGGCDVRLEEMANLYSAFANGGQLRSLCWLRGDSARTGGTVVSPEAAYVLTRILSEIRRPDLPYNYQNAKNLPSVAWKTGTSYGRRDAWSVGYHAAYTVAVWCGNFNAEGSPVLSGAEIATPLLFEIFNSIGLRYENNWFRPPASAKQRLVCSVTGALPDTFCKNQVWDFYRPGVSPAQKCTHRKPVWVSLDGKTSYCSLCLPESGYKQQFYDNLEPELIQYYDEKRLPYNKIPPHNAACNHQTENHTLTITSPANGAQYYPVSGDRPKIQLACQADLTTQKVSWFINHKFYKTAGVKEALFFSPDTGRCVVSCSDERGRQAQVTVWVRGLK